MQKPACARKIVGAARLTHSSDGGKRRCRGGPTEDGNGGRMWSPGALCGEEIEGETSTWPPTTAMAGGEPPERWEGALLAAAGRSASPHLHRASLSTA